MKLPGSSRPLSSKQHKQVETAAHICCGLDVRQFRVKMSNKRNPKSNRTLICKGRSFCLYSQLPCQRASEGNMGDSGDSSFFHKLRLRVHQRLSRSMRAGPIDRQKKLLLAGAGIIALLSESGSAAG